MSLNAEYQNLDDCLNKIEIDLINIDDLSVVYKSKYQSLPLELLEIMARNIEMIREIRKKSKLYKLEKWRIVTENSLYPKFYHAIVDEKGIQRFKVVEVIHRGLEIVEIHESYDCRKVASINDLLSKDLIKGRLFVKESKGIGKTIIYEDDLDAFLITTGSIFSDDSKHEMNSVSFLLNNIIEICYSYDKKWGYFRGTSYTAKVQINMLEWKVISNEITSEEEFKL